MAYHELRSPLALMATMARSAAEDCSDEQLRDRCLSIVRTAERMLRTAGQVMVVADAASNDVPCQFAPADVVQKVVSDYQGMDVPMALDLRGAPDRDTRVFGAPGQLEALLCSIIGNALDHGDREAPLRVTIDEDAGSVAIHVRNGLGGVRKHRGLGLGSYIGDRLARSLNATLELTRTDDEFVARITLPAHTREFAVAG